MSAFDAIEELIEMFGVDWATASEVYLFENREDENHDTRTV